MREWSVTSLWNSLFPRQRQGPFEKFAYQEAAQTVLATLPKYAREVLVVCPRYRDPHYRCDLKVAVADWSPRAGALSVSLNTLPGTLAKSDVQMNLEVCRVRSLDQIAGVFSGALPPHRWHRWNEAPVCMDLITLRHHRVPLLPMLPY